ncbi:MAG: Phosphoenolpyruvate-protein phosphotransferase [Verrucomicrobiae bacterium]|nr:Phosphoenolpyruvate-protein phosphotransferase [Verrucomicrobiae bacterium]
MIEHTKTSAMIFGEVASSGLARGPAVVCDCAEEVTVPRRTIEASEVPQEMKRFDAASFAAEQDLLKLQQQVQRGIGRQEAGIFEAQRFLLHDPLLREEVSSFCLAEKINVEAAVDMAVKKLTSVFVQVEDPYFRERAADLRDVGKRLLDILTKSQLPAIPIFPDGSVIVTGELLPSVMAQLDGQTIRGLVIEKGGQTAHATILARALGIPLLIHVPDATKTIRTGDHLIVDGLAGRVFINPTPTIRREYDRLEADLQAHQTALKGLIDLPAVTRDGVAIKLCANIGKSADAVVAATLNADGVGLYRTEFVFLVQDHFPSEEEQYQIYRTTADRLKPREVVIRALDIGSDKQLPYFPSPPEANPSLGCRGTRLLLAHPEILRAQLRAILRLSATHPVAILFPMIGGVEDLLAAKAEIEAAKASLAVEGQAFNPNVPVGAMIETPAAAIMTGRLAQEVDFFSIGTNDLVQYLLTADRTSSEAAGYYEPLHPAVLQMLGWVATTARTKNKNVSICGEIAGNPALTQLLLGLGFRSLSVNPGEILEVKNAIRATSISQAEHLAKQILELGTIQEIKDCLRALSAGKELRTEAQP